MAEEGKETTASKDTPKKGTKKKAAPKKKARAKKSAPKKAAATAKGTFDGSKTDFIMKYRSLTPLEVEAKAKDEFGMNIKAAYVSSVRSKTKAKGTNGSSGKPARAKSSSNGAEADFRKAARAITLDRAQEILDEIAAAYGA